MTYETDAADPAQGQAQAQVQEQAQAQAQAAADWLRARTGVERIDALLVLGSGWAPAVEAWGEPLCRVAIGTVPGFTAPVAEGHRGEALAYRLGQRTVLVLSGRTHLYEGHGPRPVVHGVRTAACLGASTVVLTNANGSLRPEWEVGRPVLIGDHLSLTGVSPIEGARFVDLTDAWSPRLRDLARDHDPGLVEGVYAHLLGPHYNTPAEADWLRTLGADLVGMSTVPEAIAAREAGLEMLGLSVVTAIEGGRGMEGEAIDPAEVVAAAERTARELGPLIREVLTLA